jgi:hypothetical protein
LKRLLLLLTVICVLDFFLASTAQATPNEVMIEVNNIAITPEIPPFAVSGRVMVPLRSMCEALGAKLAWNGTKRTVTVLKSGHSITVNVGSTTASVDNLPKVLDVPPILAEGTVLVPVRFIAEALGARVEWNVSTATVSISLEDVRNRMTAKDIFEKALITLNAAKSYSYCGTGAAVTRVQPSIAGPDSTNITTEFSGAFRSPKEIYSKTVVSMKNGTIGSSATESEVSETYSDGTTVYEKDPRIGWKKLDFELPTDLVNDEASQDPLEIITQLESIPRSVVFGDDVLINGNSHYAIVVKPDPYGLKDYLINEVAGTSEENDSTVDEGTDEIQALIQEGINQLFKSLRMDLTYRLYVDKQTLSVSGIATHSVSRFWAEGLGTSTSYADTVLDITGINEPVVMPGVTLEP